MLNHQFNRYVRSKGLDPESLTIAQKDEEMIKMKNDLYPGRTRRSLSCHDFSNPDDILGLEQTPNFLSDTMLPNVRPEVVAEAAILTNGGYDFCQYAVKMKNILSSAPTFLLMSLL